MNEMTTELLATFEDVQNIVVVGRRWFERTNGNTYHSAEIYVNGHMVHKIGFTYGYGNQFEWNAWTWLKNNGYIKGANSSCPSYWCRENGIVYNSTVTDVKRKKDL
jgi:hypothetical protein